VPAGKLPVLLADSGEKGLKGASNKDLRHFDAPLCNT